MSDLKNVHNRPPVSIETMLRGISNQADLIPGVIDYVLPQVRQLAVQIKNREIAHIFITGCGDSFYAGMAACLVFEKYSGCRIGISEALEFSRYSVDYLPKNSMVISISAGGDKARPIEAVHMAKLKGALTVALSGTEGSSITRAADITILQNERNFRAVPPAGEGTFAIGNYLASVVVLDLLALEIGLENGAINQDQYTALLAQILTAPNIIRHTINANGNHLNDFAGSTLKAGSYQFLGGGPNHATALFIAAKLFEMPQLHGVPVELEEWAHEQFFITRPGMPVFVITPPGRSCDRAREQMIGAKEMGAQVIAICDPEDTETQILADITFPVMGKLAEEFSPLTYCIPGELFAIALCRALNKPAFSFITPTQFQVNMRQIKESKMRENLDD